MVKSRHKETINTTDILYKNNFIYTYKHRIAFFYMDLCINFANPVECYNNFLNKCAGKFCHVEVTTIIDVSMLRFLLDSQMDDCYAPEQCQTVLNNIKQLQGEIIVAFYILFGDVMSIRILNKNEENTFLQPPTSPIYETLTLTLDEEKMYEVIKWNIRMIGRSYDIPRAVLLLTPFSYPTSDRPEKFFCSQVIMYMLKENNLLEVEDTLDMDHMKPDHVYEWLVQKIDSIKEKDDTENGEQQSNDTIRSGN